MQKFMLTPSTQWDIFLESCKKFRKTNKIQNWTKSQTEQNPEMDKIPNGQNAEWTTSQNEKIPNWTKSRIGENPELDKIPNWTKSQMDKIPNWTKSRMDNIPK